MRDDYLMIIQKVARRGLFNELEFWSGLWNFLPTAYFNWTHMERQYFKFHALGIKRNNPGPRKIFKIDYARWKFQRQGNNESKRWHLEVFRDKRICQIIFTGKNFVKPRRTKNSVMKNRTFLQFDQSLFWDFVAEVFFSKKSPYSKIFLIKISWICTGE